MLDPISRVRRFNRAVTSEVGALDTSFLGRGRPLGAARVLNAIGQGRGDVGELRDDLGLDSGLMSRLLRSLEDEGLIATAPHPVDAIRYSMAIGGHTQADLGRLLGSRQRASDILSRKRPLTMGMAWRLHREWGIPAEALLEPPEELRRR